MRGSSGAGESSRRVTGTLESHGTGTWTVLPLSPSASAKLGDRGKVRLAAVLNGVAFETTAIPNGDGTHSILVTKPTQASANVAPGDRVVVEIRPIRGGRPVVLPNELARALRARPRAREVFARLPPSHRRQWAEWVAGGKQEPTRERRALDVIERVLAGVSSRRESPAHPVERT
jgi:hypothetical protein